jgi:hypothetical protein
MPAVTSPMPPKLPVLPGSVPATAAEAEASGRFPWRAFGLRGLLNQIFCAVIALLIWSLGSGTRGTLFTAWVYSAAIGNGCWVLIDGSRLLVSRWLGSAQRPADARRAHWPGPRWMALCIVVGTGAGYTLGTAIGDAITGFHTPSLLQNRTALFVSLIVAMASTWYFYATERLRQEQANAESARRAAAESQLRLLQSQLEPHMLFNTLANLRVLIGLDPAKAQAMLDHLIGFLRATLSASRSTRHPLSAEFDRTADYLALMRVRMGERLQVSLNLPAELRDLPVPPLLLQPLVENCIQHGLEPKVEGGRITVTARREGTQLWLSVRDTGVGLDAARGSQGTGFGTRQVRERLATLYGGKASLVLSPAPDGEGGTLAELSLPLHTEAAA